MIWYSEITINSQKKYTKNSGNSFKRGNQSNLNEYSVATVENTFSVASWILLLSRDVPKRTQWNCWKINLTNKTTTSYKWTDGNMHAVEYESKENLCETC